MSNEFQFNGKTYRIRGRVVRDEDAGFGEARYNILEIKKYRFGLFPYWKQVSVERVPDSVIIDLGCFGATDWVSQFSKMMPRKDRHDIS